MQVGAITVHATWSKPPLGAPAEGIRPPDVQHLGYVIAIGGVRVYVTGDLINTFAAHDELIAPVAALAPEIGLLTMHPTEGEFPFFEGAVEMAVKLGLKAANLIGDGLYGVDIKQLDGRCVVVEINDNPNLDAGNEDGILKDALYREVMGVFLRRIEERKRGGRR